MSYIILGLMCLSFAGGGIMIRELKAYDLIAGYNTMSDEEKAHYDIKSVANQLGILLYFFALLAAIVMVLFYFGNFSLPIRELIMLGYAAIILFILGIAMLVSNKKNIRKIIPVFIIYNVIMLASLIPAFLKLLKKLL